MKDITNMNSKLIPVVSIIMTIPALIIIVPFYLLFLLHKWYGEFYIKIVERMDNG